MMYWGGDGWTLFGGLVMFLWWGLVALAIIWLVRHGARSSNEYFRYGQSSETALDILKKRYARGEIDKKEFEEKRKDIST